MEAEVEDGAEGKVDRRVQRRLLSLLKKNSTGVVRLPAVMYQAVW